MASHEMFDGRLQVYKRGEGRFWQCAARVGGRRFRASTGEDLLSRAKEVAEEWYLELRGKLRNGVIEPDERTFRSAATEYTREMRVLTIGMRSPRYVKLMELRMNRHILPFFGTKGLSKITKGVVQSYLVKRVEETIAATGKRPARNTLLHEIVHVRQVLKFAESKGWIPYVPSLSSELLKKTKTSRRAWFSPDEYKQLYKATEKRIAEGKRRGWKTHYEDLHDYVLFQANTGLRPDEAANLEVRDVRVVFDHATKETILDIDVRGKTGVGYCKSTTGAVYPFQRLQERRLAELRGEHPDKSADELNAMLRHTKLFRRFKRELFNKILTEENLKFDRDGQRRTAYSLRHTYISMRLMNGANIHQIANNCRTSVEMIEDHYAAHIRDRLLASEINTHGPRPARSRRKKSTASDEPAGPSPIL
jgi:integrase